MNNFRVFKQVPRIIYGSGSISRIKELLPKKDASNYNIYIIDDIFRNTCFPGKDNISDEDILEWFPASLGEPKTSQVDSIRDNIRQRQIDTEPNAIIGIGGGSTLDVAKALSVILCNEGSSSNYQGWDLVPNPGLYKIGIPTISGSGAEASRTAVLFGKDKKFGINSDFSMFDALILDCDLIEGVPLQQRFHSGMDCYIHCVESITGTFINELARANASKALELCERVFLCNGSNDQLMTASYMGGVSIVNSEVGICHALSYGLSLELGIRHGLANCIVFNVLDDFYGPYVDRYRQMLEKNMIRLPHDVCKTLDSMAMSRMVKMTLRMERPLANALGINWRERLTENMIRDLYIQM